MINESLLNPGSIAVVGGSNNTAKPGGSIVRNIIEGGYRGRVFIVNPHDDMVQGIAAHRNVEDLPDVDLAILAIAARLCPAAMRVLGRQKRTRAFIVLSAGFSEDSEEGRRLEQEMVAIADEVGASLVGPNCIGVITPAYSGVFTRPIPRLGIRGCDFASGSGATAVFIIESAIPKGLTFSGIFSVGNSAQIGIEEIVEFWDLTYQPGASSPTKLLYVEHIRNPDKLLHHASSLIRKGCRIAAIKAGTTEAGSRAASSHTGALASSDAAVEALFRKAGIVRCFGREELTTVASVFTYKPLQGRNIAIITHAGGPAVMLTDSLSAGGLNVPRITGSKREELLTLMNPGASADNPIDMIATATAEQLDRVIEFADTQLEFVDSIIVIFGSNGLNDIREIYELLHRKISQCAKPVLPILPSVTSSREDLEFFLALGHVNFPDEVVLGKALTRVANTPFPAEESIFLEGVDIPCIREIIDQNPEGYLEPGAIHKLLQAAGIPFAKERVVTSKRELKRALTHLSFPLVLKVVGPVHKSDVGGVTLNIKSETHLHAEFQRMMKIKGVKAVLVQEMLTGMELFIGASYEPRFGHVILCGPGGIFVEILGDISSGLAPLTFEEARSMIRSLRSYRMIQGTRGKPGINEERFTEIIVRLSSLLRFATEIKEMDLNPLIGNSSEIVVVDARVLLKKNG
jgi:acetyltransferase